MARKKKSALHDPNYLNHFFYHTRAGFYALAVVAVVGGIAAINLMHPTKQDSNVLGEKDEREESNSGKNEEQKRKDEAKREEDKQQKEAQREEHKQALEDKFNVETDGLKVQYKPFGDRVFRTVEHDEDELELDDEEENELEDEVESEFEFEEEVEIATSGGEVIVTKNKVKARSGFPLSIDVSTGQLTITRPDGTQKIVTVLPDQAVENFLRHKKVELVGTEPPGGDDGTSTESAGIQSVDEEIAQTESQTDTEIDIVERNNEVVYEIKGKKNIKLFGFVPLSTNTTGYVSTETGEVVDESQGPIATLLNLLSF